MYIHIQLLGEMETLIMLMTIGRRNGDINYVMSIGRRIGDIGDELGFAIYLK